MNDSAWLTGLTTLVIGVVSAILAFRAQRSTTQFEGYDEFTHHLRGELDRASKRITQLERDVEHERRSCEIRMDSLHREIGDLRRQINIGGAAAT